MIKCCARCLINSIATHNDEECLYTVERLTGERCDMIDIIHIPNIELRTDVRTCNNIGLSAVH